MDNLSLAISTRSISLLDMYQQEEIETFVDMVNRTQYTFPSKHFNLSIVDARYILRNHDEILFQLESFSTLYQAPSNYKNENMNSRNELAKIAYKRAATFMQYIKNITRMVDDLETFYANNWQVTKYTEYTK